MKTLLSKIEVEVKRLSSGALRMQKKELERIVNQGRYGFGDLIALNSIDNELNSREQLIAGK